jgi:uncharacterized protein (TIGR00255 family)
MIKSMTGFGKSEMIFPDKKISIEIKTLNSKGTDISIKLPGILRSREMEIRQKLSEILERGKIEASILYEMNTLSLSSHINKEVFKAYFNELTEITKELKIKDDYSIVSSILRLPEVISSERSEKIEPDENEWTLISTLLDQALLEVDNFRIQEGNVLKVDLLKRISLILLKLTEIESFEKARLDRIRERISSNIRDLLPSEAIDNNRFEQEIIFYLEKLDITEEKVRLKNHCDYFLETLNLNDSVGKKLAFISQEIGREINTLGSKASDSDIQKLVVEMKDELEKIKEQVLNLV